MIQKMNNPKDRKRKAFLIAMVPLSVGLLSLPSIVGPGIAAQFTDTTSFTSSGTVEPDYPASPAPASLTATRQSGGDCVISWTDPGTRYNITKIARLGLSSLLWSGTPQGEKLTGTTASVTDKTAPASTQTYNVQHALNAWVGAIGTATCSAWNIADNFARTGNLDGSTTSTGGAVWNVRGNITTDGNVAKADDGSVGLVNNKSTNSTVSASISSTGGDGIAYRGTDTKNYIETNLDHSQTNTTSGAINDSMTTGGYDPVVTYNYYGVTKYNWYGDTRYTWYGGYDDYYYGKAYDTTTTYTCYTFTGTTDPRILEYDVSPNKVYDNYYFTDTYPGEVRCPGETQTRTSQVNEAVVATSLCYGTAGGNPSHDPSKTCYGYYRTGYNWAPKQDTKPCYGCGWDANAYWGTTNYPYDSRRVNKPKWNSNKLYASNQTTAATYPYTSTSYWDSSVSYASGQLYPASYPRTSTSYWDASALTSTGNSVPATSPQTSSPVNSQVWNPTKYMTTWTYEDKTRTDYYNLITNKVSNGTPSLIKKTVLPTSIYTTRTITNVQSTDPNPPKVNGTTVTRNTTATPITSLKAVTNNGSVTLYANNGQVDSFSTNDLTGTLFGISHNKSEINGTAIDNFSLAAN